MFDGKLLQFKIEICLTIIEWWNYWYAQTFVVSQPINFWVFEWDSNLKWIVNSIMLTLINQIGARFQLTPNEKIFQIIKVTFIGTLWIWFKVQRGVTQSDIWSSKLNWIDLKICRNWFLIKQNSTDMKVLV